MGLISQTFELIDEDHSRTITMPEFERTIAILEMCSLVSQNEVLRDEVLLVYHMTKVADLTAKAKASSKKFGIFTEQEAHETLRAAKVVSKLKKRIKKTKRK